MSKTTQDLAQSYFQYLASLIAYPVIVAVLCVLVLLFLFRSSTFHSTPSVENLRGDVVLTDFSIPYYDDSGEQTLLVTGSRAVLSSDESLDIQSPVVSYFSKTNSNSKIIRFSAHSGRFDRLAGIAFLKDQVRIKAILKQDGCEESLWSLTGDSVSINEATGKFNVSGLVKFESPNAKLFGYDLQGKLDTKTTQLQYIHFEKNTRSLFTPE